MMLVEIFPSGPLQTNAILIGCKETGHGAVIDPAPGSTEPILQSAQKHGLKIEQILLTHSHWDHIADVKKMKGLTKAKVFIHPEDVGNLRVPGSDGLVAMMPVEASDADGFLADGQVVNVGNVQLRVIHTPGHSPGGICFYVEKEHVLFSGDTLFRGSIGHVRFSTGQPERMWPSLKKLAALPPETRVISGHGRETTIGRESWLSNAQEYLGE